MFHYIGAYHPLVNELHTNLLICRKLTHTPPALHECTQLTEEESTFRALMPTDMPWRPGVLAAAAHSAQELAAARPGVVASLNVDLNDKLSGLGIAPGREGLSDVELMAAMKQLE